MRARSVSVSRSLFPPFSRALSCARSHALSRALPLAPSVAHTHTHTLSLSLARSFSQEFLAFDRMLSHLEDIEVAINTFSAANGGFGKKHLMHACKVVAGVQVTLTHTERQRGRETQRKSDRETERQRQKDRQKDRQADRTRYRETETEHAREREREREIERESCRCCRCCRSQRAGGQPCCPFTVPRAHSETMRRAPACGIPPLLPRTPSPASFP